MLRNKYILSHFASKHGYSHELCSLLHAREVACWRNVIPLTTSYPFIEVLEEGIEHGYRGHGIVSEEALAIDYCNFKSHVHEGSPRDTAYMGCWSSLRNAQERME